jgi:hypothetical protein
MRPGLRLRADRGGHGLGCTPEIAAWCGHGHTVGHGMGLRAGMGTVRGTLSARLTTSQPYHVLAYIQAIYPYRGSVPV